MKDVSRFDQPGNLPEPNSNSPFNVYINTFDPKDGLVVVRLFLRTKTQTWLLYLPVAYQAALHQEKLIPSDSIICRKKHHACH